MNCLLILFVQLIFLISDFCFDTFLINHKKFNDLSQNRAKFLFLPKMKICFHRQQMILIRINRMNIIRSIVHHLYQYQIQFNRRSKLISHHCIVRLHQSLINHLYLSQILRFQTNYVLFVRNNLTPMESIDQLMMLAVIQRVSNVLEQQ